MPVFSSDSSMQKHTTYFALRSQRAPRMRPQAVDIYTAMRNRKRARLVFLIDVVSVGIILGAMFFAAWTM